MWQGLLLKVGRWLGHWLIYVALTALVGWSVYVAVIRPHTKPTPTTSEKAETIVHNNYDCKGLFVIGCGGKKK